MALQGALAGVAAAWHLAAWSQGATAADALPAGASFVAQDTQGRWGLHHVDAVGQLRPVPTQLEPRQACVSLQTGKVVYAAADASLRIVELQLRRAETVLAKSDARRSLTQPCLSADGRDVYAVEMMDGKSIETEIVRLNAGDGAGLRMARQPGAQLDPFLAHNRWLVYASVACSDGCDRLLEEIWLRDLLTGQARQLSLLNAVSQNPVTDGRRVVFSSNAGGAYHLWEVGTEGAQLRRLTGGADNDLYPSLCGGQLVFVRVSPAGARLMRLGADGRAVPLAVPAGLSHFRALRCTS